MLDIISSELMQPDFYRIADWRNAENTATPEYLFMMVIQGKGYVHPELYEKMMRQIPSKKVGI